MWKCMNRDLKIKLMKPLWEEPVWRNPIKSHKHFGGVHYDLDAALSSPHNLTLTQTLGIDCSIIPIIQVRDSGTGRLRNLPKNTLLVSSGNLPPQCFDLLSTQQVSGSRGGEVVHSQMLVWIFGCDCWLH